MHHISPVILQTTKSIEKVWWQVHMYILFESIWTPFRKNKMGLKCSLVYASKKGCSFFYLP